MKAFFIAKLLAFITILAFPLGASALQTDPGSALYRLQISLFDGERMVGQPNLTVADGRPAIVTVEREGGYSIQLTATRDEAQPGPSRLRVAAEVFLREGNGWRQVAAPRLTLALGTKATAETTPPAGARRSFRMEVLATQATGDAASKLSRPCTEALRSAWQNDMKQAKGAPAFKAAYAAQSGDCCSTGCLRCCGGSGVCCSDAFDCPIGCCV